jgi:hypothetical protein
MDEKQTANKDLAHEERRAFLKKAGIAAAAAPAAALLLSASSVRAQAFSASGITNGEVGVG